MVIPHRSIPILSIRPTDIQILLILGCVSQLLIQILQNKYKQLSSTHKKTILDIKELKVQVIHMRSLGPTAFVETSKLERKLLSKEKEWSTMEEERKKKIEQIKNVTKKLNYGLQVVVFVVYFGISLLNIDGLKIVTQLDDADLISSKGSLKQDETLENYHAASFMKWMMFPLGHVGLMMKLSRLGIVEKASSISALVVFWSAQIATGKILECIEVLTLK